MTIDWRNAIENPPEESGEYLVYSLVGVVTNMDYHKPTNLWNYSEGLAREKALTPYNIVAWADMPGKPNWLTGELESEYSKRYADEYNKRREANERI